MPKKLATLSWLLGGICPRLKNYHNFGKMFGYNLDFLEVFEKWHLQQKLNDLFVGLGEGTGSPQFHNSTRTEVFHEQRNVEVFHSTILQKECKSLMVSQAGR